MGVCPGFKLRLTQLQASRATVELPGYPCNDAYYCSIIV